MAYQQRSGGGLQVQQLAQGAYGLRQLAQLALRRGHVRPARWHLGLQRRQGLGLGLGLG